MISYAVANSHHQAHQYRGLLSGCDKLGKKPQLGRRALKRRDCFKVKIVELLLAALDSEVGRLEFLGLASLLLQNRILFPCLQNDEVESGTVVV